MNILTHERLEQENHWRRSLMTKERQEQRPQGSFDNTRYAIGHAAVPAPLFSCFARVRGWEAVRGLHYPRGSRIKLGCPQMIQALKRKISALENCKELLQDHTKLEEVSVPSGAVLAF